LGATYATWVNWFSSHGCVGLELEDAKKLFSWAEIYTSVFVKEIYELT